MEMRKLNRKLLILIAIAPVGCLAGLLFGLFIGWQLLPVEYTNTEIGDLSPSDTEEFVVMVATEFCSGGDVARAHLRLTELDVANPEQYVAYLADKYVQEDRGAADRDTLDLVCLAEGLNVSSQSMVAYVATPTSPPTLTFTPLPTATPTPAPTHTPTPPPTDTPDVEQAEDSTPTPPTENAAPTEGPPPPTATPAPPTETPAPTPPAVDFVMKEARMLTKEENGGCRGGHQIFISVVDANGQPLAGAVVTDIPEFGNFRVTSGDKSEPLFDWGTVLATIDMFKGSTKLLVAEYPPGNPVTSETSPTMGSNDWEIGIPLLIEKGYCTDEAQCSRDWNSGVAGQGANALCWGHYSWWIVFQATHPF